ncbi:hypothetical protein [Nocardia sp. NPDC057668]|uniref:hypothetical protein n=1 Tax=Nocardia sp. NPDC057668 TaxID=3346202 RepID=UPI00366E0BB0
MDKICERLKILLGPAPGSIGHTLSANNRKVSRYLDEITGGFSREDYLAGLAVSRSRGSGDRDANSVDITDESRVLAPSVAANAMTQEWLAVKEFVRKYDPVLARRISDLERYGRTIRYGDAGSGSSTLPGGGITIDGRFKGDTLGAVSVLAHEVGHAHQDTYSPEYIPFEGKTREEWAAQDKLEAIRDEGDAEIERMASRARTLINGGPEIIIPNYDAYSTVYHQLICGEIPRDVARELIGNMYASIYGLHDEFLRRSERLWDSLGPGSVRFGLPGKAE